MIIKVMKLFINYLNLSKFLSLSLCLVYTIFYTLFWMINLKNIVMDILLFELTVVILANIRPLAFKYLNKIFQITQTFFHILKNFFFNNKLVQHL